MLNIQLPLHKKQNYVSTGKKQSSLVARGEQIFLEYLNFRLLGQITGFSFLLAS